jgi:hypothetical protein
MNPLPKPNNICPNSMEKIMMEQKQYSEKVNKGVKSMKYATKIPYPKFFTGKVPQTIL